MPITPALPVLHDQPFDEVIDVRAPSEFAEDHVPGAISLPVLSDAERATVGTIYVREDRFRARKIGAALVARNAAAHLEGPLADRTGGWRPLVYCWRGGQRSGSFTTILSQVGWRADTVAGGYKAYRAQVKALLYDAALPHRLVLIDGGTGTAKTHLLHHLAAAGAQTIDLEGIAVHRGSNFGSWPGEPQPSQKWFESQLADALVRADPARPLFLEAESTAIGRIRLPPSLWAAMGTAEVVRLDAPAHARAAHLVRAYPDLSDPTLLCERIDSLRPYNPRDRIEAWHAMAAEGRLEPLAAALIEHHYDPRYRDHGGARREVLRLRLEDLSDGALAGAAERIVNEI
ncbi:tRNA 2-selenouridine(34) synthase MnmH [Jannaschia sp. Os4]|uniref:tRNA 2-selenouridine(34) synthase MnmH n=1 Tax=Jannaschia sp. Os4 TaxID=2807617 RepID=UPI001939B166|nr:tRNA 2-selenouridine(34) synthase MnmH [Jannaschia sp. Os4]MBM2577759.1 tRNA 2-selenouridine(34) synthase MnmH [Jannaschia sp. Os4]